MKKLLVSCLLLSFWVSFGASNVWAIDVGWMQNGVRVWYMGAVGTGGTSDTEEAYLFTSINGNTAQLIHNSGINHWTSPTAVSETGSVIGEGPFWIHPQVLQSIAVGDTWRGIRIYTKNQGTYTYDTFKNTSELSSLPYLLLPIKTLFDLESPRDMVKIVYMMEDFSTGTAYFDAETGLLLFRTNSTGFVTVFFILSEINYDFASQQAFAEDNGPHTGFKSNIIKTSSAANYVMIQSSVETRYGNTVQMWVSTSENSYSPPYENYCFFGSVPILRRINMTVASNYPPEQWNEYGQYLWWWVPTEILQHSTINVFGVPMTRTSTNPYTFTATQQPAGLFFSKLWFDNDGYMTQFSAKDSTTGLDIDPERSASFYKNTTTVNGLSYYRNTIGRAVPVNITPKKPSNIAPLLPLLLD